MKIMVIKIETYHQTNIFRKFASIVLIPLDQNINMNLMKKYVKNKDFCGIAMPSEKDNILEFKQNMK